MKIKLFKLIRLISGFMFCALGIVLMVNKVILHLVYIAKIL